MRRGTTLPAQNAESVAIWHFAMYEKNTVNCQFYYISVKKMCFVY